VVQFTREYPFFVLDGIVKTGSVYWLDNHVLMVEVGYEGAGDDL